MKIAKFCLTFWALFFFFSFFLYSFFVLKSGLVIGCQSVKSACKQIKNRTAIIVIPTPTTPNIQQYTHVSVLITVTIFIHHGRSFEHHLRQDYGVDFPSCRTSPYALTAACLSVFAAIACTRHVRVCWRVGDTAVNVRQAPHEWLQRICNKTTVTSRAREWKK